MKKNLFYIVLLLLAYGCQNSSKQLVDIMIDVDRETFNPVLEPDVTGSISIVGIYSNGTNEPLTDCEITLSAKTKVASGNVRVVELEGNKIIPKEGGIATIEAVVIKDGQTLKSEKDIVVRPYFRDYHQTLVLKLFMGMDGEVVEKRENDIVFNRKDPGRICTFEETLEVVKKTDNLTRGIPKIIYLVGWQKGGHDHLYPAWNEANPKLKREEDATAVESLRWLIREARQYNTTISLHINMVDCFKDDPLWDEYVKRDIIARDENGDILQTWENVKDHKMSHLSYTREWAEGMAQKRIDGLIEMLPELKEGHTIHIDVFIAMWKPGNRPLSPWHAKPENGGIDMYKEVETQRKIFKYWRERGFDVTGEGILWAHPPGEGFYGLQPMAWWYPGDRNLQMRIPENLLARGRTNRENQGDYRFTSSMQGETIYLKDKENMPGFLDMFCKTTLPWYYLSQHERVSFVDEVLYYSDGIKAGEEEGTKIIRRGNYVLREDNNLFVEAKWKEKEIIAYSEEGYDNKQWQMPDGWAGVSSVDLYRITIEGVELVESDKTIEDGKLILSLDKGEAFSIVPKGSEI